MQMQHTTNPAWAAHWAASGGGANAVTLAPRIRALFESLEISDINRTLLDLCCGTGELIRYFADAGYVCVGMDVSEAMLAVAQQQSQGAHQDRVTFIHADVSSEWEFEVGKQFALVTCTFDSIHTVGPIPQIERTFANAARVLLTDGLLCVDLHTSRGFADEGNTTIVRDCPTSLMVYTSIYPGGDTSLSRHVGFVRSTEDSPWERVEEHRLAHVFKVAELLEGARRAGFSRAYAASPDDLGIPLEDPESLPRILLIAQR